MTLIEFEKEIAGDYYTTSGCTGGMFYLNVIDSDTNVVVTQIMNDSWEGYLDDLEEHLPKMLENLYEQDEELN